MIRFVLCLLGALFIQAAVMAHTANGGSTDFFTSFGEGLRASVNFDIGIVRNAATLVGAKLN
ncbi:MAG: hypothetical protein RXR20_03355 [Paraburkholderia sp.]|jgi:hypothetical protein|uniref:Uncharacterized protein n=1 Tax=Paraburkholderia phytofirmans OLGA172 TaxID=1417228 RepID=A0A167WRX2_9BURK|nr:MULTISPECIES: hypothetical protein [Burkholderiaceae]ANB78092.1 hypothetical protein AYM40_37695 [Paraburkholderia phytofirmans OLGA172]